MATDITMPKLSDTMTEGRLISWKKNVGDKVQRGDVIAEVETDKANMELESFSDGFLLETRAKAGDTVAVGTVIGVIGESGEKVAPVPGAVQQEEPRPAEPAVGRPETEPEAVPSKQERPPSQEEPPSKEASPPTPPRQEERPPQPEAPAGAGEVPGPDLDLEEKAPPSPEEHAEAPERASPLVRRLARERGIDLREVKGSGPDGRILQEDLDRLMAQARPAEKDEQGVPPLQPGQIVPLSRMRQAIARTVTQSWTSAPHFTVTIRVLMSQAEKMYKSLKGSGRKLSLNDLVTKACALALVKYPLVNATFTANEIRIHPDINIGIMVSLEDGLLVPVVKRCQDLSLLEIGQQSVELVSRARAGKISESDLSGGTFSISNLGMFGVEEFTAVIYPPQGAILAVGSVLDEAVVKGGQIAAQRTMRVTLSADHRLLDGAYAARFLGEVKRMLENPALMLVAEQ